ncbi:hypothetical protein IAD21_02374 [Abditibacteriota bacterium]|nr:hypothetical protein IAD21_02374 [Abditibacteriota bacterium]
MSHIADILPLLREVNDLKRVRVASREGSLAEQLFMRAWGRLARGEPLKDVAASETARAVVAARLGGIDAEVLSEAGLNDEEIGSIFERAFDSITTGLNSEFAEQLKAAINPESGFEPNDTELPQFVLLLARQPRVRTKPAGAVRMTESHAEHCGVVAVNSYLVASSYGAAPERAFFMGLCHNVHYAFLPDAGATGEQLLGDKLTEVVEACRGRALAQLPAWLQHEARASLESLSRGDTTESRAFQTGDSADDTLEQN